MTTSEGAGSNIPVRPEIAREFRMLKVGDRNDKVEVLARLRGKDDWSLLLRYLEINGLLRSGTANRVAGSPLRLEQDDLERFLPVLRDIACGDSGVWEAWYACVAWANCAPGWFLEGAPTLAAPSAEATVERIAILESFGVESLANRLTDMYHLAFNSFVGEGQHNSRWPALYECRDETIRALSLLHGSDTALAKLVEPERSFSIGRPAILGLDTFKSWGHETARSVDGSRTKAWDIPVSLSLEDDLAATVVGLAALGDERGREKLTYLADVKDSEIARIALQHFGTESFDEIARAILGSRAKATESRCFIASVIYGSATAPEVLAFRRFRDEMLLPRRVGRVVIAAYENSSPALAELLAGTVVLRNAARSILNVLVKVLHFLMSEDE